jgi:hypothetical protein
MSLLPVGASPCLCRVPDRQDALPILADQAPAVANGPQPGDTPRPAPQRLHGHGVRAVGKHPDRSVAAVGKHGNGSQVDLGIYLIKDGKPFWEPGDMRLINNDPQYNEQWPRPLVPYKRIYGVDEPARLPSLRNDGKRSKHLPAGTPFGLVGTSSLYKRESFPLGVVSKGSVTSVGAPYAAFPTGEYRTNWDGQGADAGLYSNSDIHAIRILAMGMVDVGTAASSTLDY